jgi:hypothetical protein
MFWGYALGGLIQYIAARVAARGRDLTPGLDERLRH